MGGKEVAPWKVVRRLGLLVEVVSPVHQVEGGKDDGEENPGVRDKIMV